MRMSQPEKSAAAWQKLPITRGVKIKVSA